MSKIKVNVPFTVPIEIDTEDLQLGDDLVAVVRCKDCCYWDRETVRQNSNDVSWWNEAVCRQHSVDGNEPHEMWTDADWFCANGERRSE